MASMIKLHPHLFWHISIDWLLTHWGRVTHKCVSKLIIIGSDNGLPPGRRQAIIWTNAELLLIGPLRTNFSEILIEILTFSFKKMRLKVSSGKWRPSCPGLNVLTITKVICLGDDFNGDELSGVVSYISELFNLIFKDSGIIPTTSSAVCI